VEDVDIDGEVDDLGAVERLRDGIGYHGLRTTRLYLCHEVPAHLVLAHPRERLGRWPVAPQPDLHEIPALHDARFDEPAHWRPVRAQHAPGGVCRIGVRIEVHHAETP